MPNLSNYPFKSARVIDGKTYITVDELNEILDNLQNLGPTFAQIAATMKDVRAAFTTANKTANLIVEEVEKAEGTIK